MELNGKLMAVFPQDNVDTLEESIRVRVQDKDLKLSLLLKEDELAPLFSGAAWAGTLLWDAAIYLTRHFLATYSDQLQSPTNKLRVLELGAGIGVPGMAARVAGAKHVVISEQPELVELMERNIADNAAVLTSNGSIAAREFSWGVDETQTYLTQYPNEPIDVVLSCDCIYEPLYGKSWMALAQTMEALCVANNNCVVLMGVERRNQDGIDKFLAFVSSETRLQWTLREETTGTKQNRLELYYLNLPV